MMIREFFTRDPKACLPSDDLKKAGEIMDRCNCGFVPVVSDMTSRKIIGVVTDRDIALCLTRTGRPAGKVKVQECMTAQPKTIHPESELDDAVRLMEAAAVHRLPVVDEGGKLIGVLSLKDIALLASREEAMARPSELERQLAELLETIAAAR